jgi:hypothetical protein
LALGVANWPPKFDGILFQPWGQYKAIKFSILLVTWGRLKSFFSISASTPSVKPLGLILTFGAIEMLDSG